MDKKRIIFFLAAVAIVMWIYYFLTYGATMDLGAFDAENLLFYVPIIIVVIIGLIFLLPFGVPLKGPFEERKDTIAEKIRE